MALVEHVAKLDARLTALEGRYRPPEPSLSEIEERVAALETLLYGTKRGVR